ncbi:uncharacterized protein LOC142175883 [Nicotiana tabacum]|uniref:Uncharacterized protein LOC142175883 n=1 Tax=Nicotiana tabacum TaxID=4097 RepID=A0AC58TP51_TOBAC
MQLDIEALEDNHTWSIVDLPPGKIPIGCRWVYRIKYKAYGEMDVHNAFLNEIFIEEKAGNDIVIILVYVDDLLITGNNQQLLCDIKADLKKRFKMKDLGELKFFLGIEFARFSASTCTVLRTLTWREH